MPISIDLFKSLEYVHPARAIPFGELYENLLSRSGGRKDSVIRVNKKDDLELFIYTEKCVYDNAWDLYSCISRGLILCPEKELVVATPFPKFFNIGEGGVSYIPNEPFETFEKMDGSLGIIFYHDNEWRIATKGSLSGDVQQIGARLLKNIDTDYLCPGETYICEIISQQNKIVVPYDYEGLVLIGGYNVHGEEMSYKELIDISENGFRLPQRKQFATLQDVIDYTKPLDYHQEGFVIRWKNGHRYKVKSSGYLEKHKITFSFSPLSVWEAMMNMGDLDEYRKGLPEELWDEFDHYVSIFNNKLNDILTRIQDTHERTKHLSNKELGESINRLFIDNDVKSFIFEYRNGKFNRIDDPESKIRKSIFRLFRPNFNQLMSTGSD